MRILVVDDDQDTRLVLRDWLNWLGHDVVVAASGPEALQQLSESQFDGVLLDLIMPEMNGLEVLRHMRARGLTTPVIIVSGYENFGANILEEGAQAFLVKPIDRGSLEASLSRHFGLPKRQH